MTHDSRHLARGRETRQRVLAFCLQVATAEGLQALTLGRVASAAAVTKAGLLGHFGSKENLQIETLNAGEARFTEAVIAPSKADPPGLPGLVRLLDRWIHQITHTDGGCFFASVTAEFDSRPGPIRDHVRNLVDAWVDQLTRRVEQATTLGHLRTPCNAREVAFRLHGCELVLNLRVQLMDEADACKAARQAMRAVLDEVATPKGRRALKAEQEP